MKTYNIFNNISILCMIIILSSTTIFGQNVWQPPDSIDLSKSVPVFDTYNFQRGIVSDQSLATLEDNTTFFDPNESSYGFGGKVLSARFFFIGTLYSQALANLQSEEFEAASDRLSIIKMEFINLDAPSSLFNYLSKIENMIKTKKYSSEILEEFAALLEPFLEDYAKEYGSDNVIMFHAGSWFVNMRLAAAAENTEMLKATEKFRYFLSQFETLESPKGVLDALNDLIALSEKEILTDKDISSIQKLITKIQLLLS